MALPKHETQITIFWNMNYMDSWLFWIFFCSVKETPEIDKHPEKRMKAAYEEFEKERIPQLKIENPTLRLSQLKQLLR